MDLNNKKTIEGNFGAGAETNTSKKKVNDEKWLRIIANIILFAGIAASIYFISFIKMTVEENTYSESGEIIGSYNKSEFNWNVLLIVLAVLFGSFLIWSFLRVITNISNSLKELKNK